jgi:Tfp pilus assembly protein PilX
MGVSLFTVVVVVVVVVTIVVGVDKVPVLSKSLSANVDLPWST